MHTVIQGYHLLRLLMWMILYLCYLYWKPNGKTSIASFDSFSNQQINSITGCDQKWRNYLFFNLRRLKKEIFLEGSSGSTMPIINKSLFEKLSVLSPNNKLLDAVDNQFQGTLNSIIHNTAMNVALSKLRDTLLSGELRIPDAEKLIIETQA